MFSKKEVEIYETDHSLSIVLDWFTPVAYFLAFFSTIWCGFLIVWYSIVLVGGAPLMAALFPLVHVAAGVAMVYYTLCLFKNKTYIDIDRNYLSVSHKPIPWWKGNNDITTDQVEQIYVKEKISSGKNGTSISYELRVKMKNGVDKELFNLQNLESHEVLNIEKRIEAFLGIPDEPVRGEYGVGFKSISSDNTEAPRRQIQNFSNTMVALLYKATMRDYFTIKSEEHKVSAISQYDWNDGDSDNFFQLLNDDRKAKFIYVEQDKALLTAFEEENIPVGKTGFSTFSKENPPASFEIAGATFYFTMTKKGVAFIKGVSRKTEITQWLYQSTDKKQQIRIIDFDGQITCYQGKQMLESDFERGLDLNNPPVRGEEQLRERSWDEEDFV